MGLYETDFMSWCWQQAAALQNKEYENLDLKNLREEIETLGRSEKKALRSYLQKLLMHMLKKEIQNDYENIKGWERTIKNCRKQIIEILKENPSLKNQFISCALEEWEDARDDASFETFIPIKSIRKNCYTNEEIMDVEDWDVFLKDLKKKKLH